MMTLSPDVPTVWVISGADPYIFCAECGDKERLELPRSLRDTVDAIEAFEERHPRGKTPHQRSR